MKRFRALLFLALATCTGALAAHSVALTWQWSQGTGAQAGLATGFHLLRATGSTVAAACNALPVGTSTTSVSIPPSPTQTFNATTGSFVTGSRVRATSSATGQYVEGVATVTGTSVSIAIDIWFGSGAHTDWVLVSTTTPYATITGPTNTSYTDTAVSEGQILCYAVTAYNQGGDSVPAPTASATIPFSVPAPATGLTATPL